MTQSTSAIFNLRCSQNNQAINYCISTKCNQPSAICSQNDCQCKAAHQKCRRQSPISIINKSLIQKITSYSSIMTGIVECLDQAIHSFVKLKQEIQNNTKTFNYGLYGIEMEFMNKIKEQKHKEMISQDVQKVISSLQSEELFPQEAIDKVSNNLKNYSKTIMDSLLQIKKLQNYSPQVKKQKEKQIVQVKESVQKIQKQIVQIQLVQEQQKIVHEQIKQKEVQNKFMLVQNQQNKDSTQQTNPNSKSKKEIIQQRRNQNKNKREQSQYHSEQHKISQIRLHKPSNPQPQSQPQPKPQSKKVQDIKKYINNQSIFQPLSITSKYGKFIKEQSPENSWKIVSTPPTNQKKWRIIVFNPKLSTSQNTNHIFTIFFKNASGKDTKMFLYGVCYLNAVKTNKFQWKAKDDRASYVMVGHNGSTFSAKNSSLNINKPHYLKKGVYHFLYNDIEKLATFTHRPSSAQNVYQTTLQIQQRGDPLHFCIAMLEPNDQLQISYETQQVK